MITYTMILLTMIFIHCIMDFHVQGNFLATFKQKKNWIKDPEYKDMYKYDYIVCLFIHSFEWSFAIQLPLLVLTILKPIDLEYQLLTYIAIILVNTFIHVFIDTLKANVKTINLVTDQIMHLVQIIFAWIAIIAVYISGFQIF